MYVTSWSCLVDLYGVMRFGGEIRFGCLPSQQPQRFNFHFLKHPDNKGLCL